MHNDTDTDMDSPIHNRKKNAPVDVLGARGERGELGLLPRLLLDLRHLFFFFFVIGFVCIYSV